MKACDDKTALPHVLELDPAPFKKARVTGAQLPTLSLDTLTTEMGLSKLLGKKVLREIDLMLACAADPPSPPPPSRRAKAAAGGESSKAWWGILLQFKCSCEP